MGMAWALTSLASLTGGPIGGAFVNLETATFIGAQIWSGIIMLIGAALFVVLWFFLWRQGKKVLI